MHTCTHTHANMLTHTRIPAYGFGDISTQDRGVFSFLPEDKVSLDAVAVCVSVHACQSTLLLMA